MENNLTTTTVRAALYARVSSEQQTQQSTIQSQVEALQERIRGDGLTLEDDLRFIDDGYTGSTLTRPALERLRDIAWAGGFQRLYVHSPDRLARKYAWQVLLVEELQHCGVELSFLNHTIGESPEENLLLQMQGMIAEYERAKIMERSRRGKRHAARRGDVSVLAAAPYGYRFISKHAGGGEACYQAALVGDELFTAVAELLAEKKKRHQRYIAESTGYLLQGLLECGCCGRNYYGKGMLRFHRTQAQGEAIYPYYRCPGGDSMRHGGTKVCDSKPVRLDRLDAAVWSDVCTVLQNPQDLQNEFERRLQGAPETDAQLEHFLKQIAHVQRGISRLIDAYETGLLEKDEFEPRVRNAKQRLARLESEAAEARNRVAQRANLQQVLGQLENFAEQVRDGLRKADWNTRREIIRSLIKTIKVDKEHIRITYRVSPRPFASGPSRGQIRHFCHRRVLGDHPRDRGQGKGISVQEG